MRRATLSLLVAVLALALGGRVAAADGFRAGTNSFALVIDGDRSYYRSFFATVMPGATLEVALLADGPAARFGAAALDGGPAPRLAGRELRWTAPQQPGRHALVIRRLDTGEATILRIFVLRPHGEMAAGRLNGYRIGAYPRTALKGLAIYRAPPGFIEVTPGIAATPLSPHFTLGQFLCKQEGGFPKYLLVRPKLILKLERILAELNRAGIRADTLEVMSGYRTPDYNRALGNGAYSRHLWGGAADIYVDVAPKDGDMDDLNGDGVSDARDAAWLSRFVDRLYGGPLRAELVGGLGVYGRNAFHGPFVHVDVRGFPARWGKWGKS